MTMILTVALAALAAPDSTSIQPLSHPWVATRTAPQEKPAGQDQETEFDKAIKGFAVQQGVFNVYSKDETVYFEIPKKELGKDFLWYAEVKQAATGSGNYSGSGLDQAVLRFEERGDKILLRSVNYANRADPELQNAVTASNLMPIITVMPVKAKSPFGGLLIEVGRMFKGGIAQLAAGATNADQTRSFVEKVTAFPKNVNVEALVTSNSVTSGQIPTGRRGGGAAGGSVLIHHSIVKLPEQPMMGRLKDSRVGYFDSPFVHFGNDTKGTQEFAYINRYRLVKKDPTAALSEPVDPIVYYVGREVPEKWRAAVKRGIEAWQPAFEAAGFKNAILAKDPPSKDQDPNWSEEDVRYSVVRWAALPIENALGPSVADPRSGEILSAHSIIWHDVLKLGVDWYFAQASACDPRAQKFPFPDDLTADILEFIVAHEIGHTLGLPHNMKSSGMVPVEWLRDPKWTKENGTCTSIMDYARFNYVAQPGDGAKLVPMVGAYDRFAIKWGYAPLNASTPEAEKSTLDAWASAQIGNPRLRFGDPSGTDPTALMEALGDDAVKASQYSVLNLKRTMGFLEKSSVAFGEDYDRLGQSHRAVTGQFSMYIGHVGAMIGGMVFSDNHAGRGGLPYAPVPKERQAAAVSWLLDNCVDPPVWLYPVGIANKVGSDMSVSSLTSIQSRGFATMLNDARLARMIDNEVRHGGSALSVAEMFRMVRDKVWKSLSGTKPTTTHFQRAAQRAWVANLVTKLGSGNGEIRSRAIGELRTTAAMVRAVRGADQPTASHLEDLTIQIRNALEFPPSAAAAAQPTGLPFFLDEAPKGCFVCTAG